MHRAVRWRSCNRLNWLKVQPRVIELLTWLMVRILRWRYQPDLLLRMIFYHWSSVTIWKASFKTKSVWANMQCKICRIRISFIALTNLFTVKLKHSWQATVFQFWNERKRVTAQKNELNLTKSSNLTYNELELYTYRLQCVHMNRTAFTWREHNYSNWKLKMYCINRFKNLMNKIKKCTINCRHSKCGIC